MKATLWIAAGALALACGCGPSSQEKAAQAKQDEAARVQAILKEMEARQKAPVLTGSEPVLLGPEGLKYLEEKVGTGKETAAGDTVTVQFIGWCEGRKLDSSEDRGKPHAFIVGQGSVLRGWDLGLVGMKEGGTRLLILPPELAYGHEGLGGAVGPDKTLLYRIELVKVIKSQSRN